MTENSENSVPGKKKLLGNDEPAVSPGKKTGRRGGEARKRFAGFKYFYSFY